ncbi:LOW QUALITY PROTEIN: small ribosomal subunit protein eS4-like [Rhynchonycteris naso]
MVHDAKKHLKHVEFPKHWMLDELISVFAPQPSTGSHKLRECLPLLIFLRNKPKYVLTGDEVKKICICSLLRLGKVTSRTYPSSFMDAISIFKISGNFDLIYDQGCFAIHHIIPEKVKYKLYNLSKIFVGTKGIPHLLTYDACTGHYPDPLIKVKKTIHIDLETSKITTDFIKFDVGNLCMVTRDANLGRIVMIANRDTCVRILPDGTCLCLCFPAPASGDLEGFLDGVLGFSSGGSIPDLNLDLVSEEDPSSQESLDLKQQVDVYLEVDGDVSWK